MLVKDVMQAHPVTATVETRLPQLARLLQRRGFRHLPVVDKGKLVGIISDRDVKQSMTSAALVTEGAARVGLVTETDVLQLFVRAMGVLEPSSRLDVILRGPVAGLGDVVLVAESTGSRIVSLMTLALPSGEREIVLRLDTIDPGPAVNALKAGGYAVKNTRADQPEEEPT